MDTWLELLVGPWKGEVTVRSPVAYTSFASQQILLCKVIKCFKREGVFAVSNAAKKCNKVRTDMQPLDLASGDLG